MTMFRFFTRVKTIVSSELNALLNKAEDPVKLLDQFIYDMENDIADVEAAVAKQITNEKVLTKQYEEANALLEKREQQAIKALEAGEEDLARRVIEDKQKQQQQVDSLKGACEEAKQLSDELKERMREMKDELRDMKMRKDSLKARAESAKARTKINRSLSGIGTGAKNGFDRMEEKVLRSEAEAESTEELRSANKSLDDEIAALSKNNSVEDELAALKAKIQNKNE